MAASDSYNSLYFPVPWDDVAGRFLPLSIKDALKWVEYIALANQTLYSAIRKLVSYFVTDIEIFGTTPKEEERIREYLYDILHINNILFNLGMDYIIYGNSFTTFYTPLIRQVQCPKCFFASSLETYAELPGVKFEFQQYKIKMTCIRCGYRGMWYVYEWEDNNPEKLKVLRWSPHDIDIIYDELTDNAKYVLRIPAEYKAAIQRGSIFHLARVPTDVLQAIKHNKDIVLSNILHLKEAGPAGVALRGWGLSPILAAFRQTWYIETLKRANLALAQDFMLPLRILSPMPRPGTAPSIGDALLTTGLDAVSARLSSIINEWRKDPTSWFTCPFPIDYRVFGGEGSRVIPFQVTEQAGVDLIAGMNIPLEFYKGTLTIQAAPMALRLLESSWGSIGKILNTFLRHLASKLTSRYRWDEFKLKLSKPSHMDDVNRQMAKLQLAMNDIISRTTGLRGIGLEFEEEMERKLKEQEREAEEAMKAQKRMEQLGMGEMLAQPQAPQQGVQPNGAVSAMGMTPQAGGSEIDQFIAQVATPKTPVTLEDIISGAQQLAQQLFGMHPSLRASVLRRLKAKNEVLHSQTIKELEKLYQEASLQGRIQAQQAAQQQSQMQ